MKKRFFALTMVLVALSVCAVLTGCGDKTPTPVDLAAPAITLNQETGKVSWAAVPGATSYYVKVGSAAEVDNGALLEYTVPVSTLAIGSYDITVRAISTNSWQNDSAASNVVTYVKSGKFAAPVIQLDSQMLSWAPIANVTSYSVYVNSDAAITLTGDAIVPDGDLIYYEIETFVKGANTVKIKANANAAVFMTESDFSNIESYNKVVTLDMPTGVEIDGSTLKWEAVTDAIGYKITIGTDEAGAKTIDDGEVESFDLDEFELAAGAQYQVRIVALGDSANNYGNSYAALITYTITKQLTAPADLDCTTQPVETTAAKIISTLTWEAVDLADYYVVTYKVSPEAEVVSATVEEGTSYAFPITVKGKFDVSVVAKSNSELYPDSPAGTLEVEIYQRLDVPTVEMENGVYSWTAVGGATGYELMLSYYSNGNVNLVKELATSVLEYDLLSDSTIPFVGINISLIAVGDEDEYDLDSYSFPTNTLYNKTTTLADPVISLLEDNGSYYIAFEDKGYSASQQILVVYNENVSSGDYYKHPDSSNTNPHITTITVVEGLCKIDITYTITSQYVGDSLTIKVRVIGDGSNVTTSQYSNELSYSSNKLKATSLSMGGDYMLRWTAVPGAAKYELYSGDDLIATMLSSELSYDLSLPAITAKEHSLTIKAIPVDGSGHIASTSYSFTRTKLATPTYTFNEGTFTLAEGTGSLYVKINDGDEEYISTTTYAPTFTASGTYSIKFRRATSPYANIISSWSEVKTVTVTVLGKPTGVDITSNVITWDAVPDAVSYDVVIAVGSTTNTHNVTTTSYTFTTDPTALEAGIYSVSIIAKPEGDDWTEYASVASDTYTIAKLAFDSASVMNMGGGTFYLMWQLNYPAEVSVKINSGDPTTYAANENSTTVSGAIGDVYTITAAGNGKNIYAAAESKQITMSKRLTPMAARNGLTYSVLPSGVIESENRVLYAVVNGGDPVPVPKTQSGYIFTLTETGEQSVQFFEAGNNGNILDSDLTVADTVTVTQLAAATDLALTDKTLSWTAVDGAFGYRIQIDDGTPTYQFATTTYDMTDILSGLEAGVRTIKLFADAGFGTAILSSVATIQVSVVSAPAMLSFAEVDGVYSMSILYVGIPAVTASTFHIYKDGNKIGETLYQAFPLTTTFTLTEAIELGDVFKIVAYNTGDDAIYITNASSEYTMTVSKLAFASAPTYSYYYVRWGAVAGATGYKIKIETPEGHAGIADTTLASNATSHYVGTSSLGLGNADAPVGNYVVKIQILGNGKTTFDSEWVTAYTFTKLATPACTYDYDTEKLTITNYDVYSEKGVASSLSINIYKDGEWVASPTVSDDEIDLSSYLTENGEYNISLRLNEVTTSSATIIAGSSNTYITIPEPPAPDPDAE